VQQGFQLGLSYSHISFTAYISWPTKLLYFFFCAAINFFFSPRCAYQAGGPGAAAPPVPWLIRPLSPQKLAPGRHNCVLSQLEQKANSTL